MVFTIFAEAQDLSVFEYTVTINASYSEIEAASKSENFISWVVQNATSIEVYSMSDYTSNDFLETVLWNGDKKLNLYYIASTEDMKLLPKAEDDEEDEDYEY